MTTSPVLTFHEVDDLEHGLAQSRLASITPTAHVPERIGPVLELLQFSTPSAFDRVKPWMTGHPNLSLVDRIAREKLAGWGSTGGRLGFLRATRNGLSDEKLNGFQMNAQRAAHQISGLSEGVARQLVAAMGEVESNIHNHSEAAETGFVAYQADEGAFEFVASDRGIGVLQSLTRCDAYVDLTDEGQALQTALREGESRFGPNSRHGYGFRPIFVGLANLRCDIRFRSGDHALEIRGAVPELLSARIRQKAAIDGFFVNVRCVGP